MGVCILALVNLNGHELTDLRVFFKKKIGIKIYQ